MARARLGPVVAVLLLAAGCAAEREVTRADLDATRTAPAPRPSTAEEPRADRPAPDPSGRSGATEEPSGPEPSEGRPAQSVISIPVLGLSGLTVVPYRGRTDDAPGTRIQNEGHAASPYGPRGGVGPGGVGNYQVTGHRLSSTMPFRYLPRLQHGEEVRVDVGDTRYVYSIVATRWTSFRSPRSLQEQRAAVPGRPGVEPTWAMITLSTCATIEDHAAGNFWSDQFDNPEHRIDKIGVLERVVRL
jgi:sortase A